MARPSLLSAEAIAAWLQEHPQWSVVDGSALTRQFQFVSFSEAFGFMTQVALLAERLDHHPEWSNVYNAVTVTMRTHDVGGITELDTTLCQAMDSITA